MYGNLQSQSFGPRLILGIMSTMFRLLDAVVNILKFTLSIAFKMEFGSQSFVSEIETVLDLRIVRSQK